MCILMCAYFKLLTEGVKKGGHLFYCELFQGRFPFQQFGLAHFKWDFLSEVGSLPGHVSLGQICSIPAMKLLLLRKEQLCHFIPIPKI